MAEDKKIQSELPKVKYQKPKTTFI